MNECTAVQNELKPIVALVTTFNAMEDLGGDVAPTASKRVMLRERCQSPEGEAARARHLFAQAKAIGFTAFINNSQQILERATGTCNLMCDNQFKACEARATDYDPTMVQERYEEVVAYNSSKKEASSTRWMSAATG